MEAVRPDTAASPQRRFKRLTDISTIVFVFSIMVVGGLLTATIRRDFNHRTRLRRDLQRQTERLRTRRREAERH